MIDVSLEEDLKETNAELLLLSSEFRPDQTIFSPLMNND